MEEPTNIKKIKSIGGEEVLVDLNSRIPVWYCNKKREIVSNVEIIEDGWHSGFFVGYKENGTVDSIEERMKFANSPVMAQYFLITLTDRDDKDKTKWNKIVKYIEQHRDELFDEHGNWKAGANIDVRKIV